MPISKINTGAIHDSAITLVKTDNLFENTNFTGDYIRVPAGDTASRPSPATSGMIRFNTDDNTLEQYNGTNWASIAAAPAINSISPTDYNGESGTVITINGANFTDDVSVKFIDANGTEYTSPTVTYVSSLQVTATTPQDFTVAQGPLDIKIQNGTGFFTLEDALSTGGVPTWTTASGSLGSSAANTSFSATIVATDPDTGGTVTYAVTTSSLPSGFSLDANTGAITSSDVGDPDDTTTYTFGITPTDNAGNDGAEREFSVQVQTGRDTNFPYTLALLNAEDSSGKSNGVIKTTSPSLTATSSGTKIQGSYGPFATEAGKWALACDNGAGMFAFEVDTSGGELNIGTGDFTFETWYKKQPGHNTTAWDVLLTNTGDTSSWTTGFTVATAASTGTIAVYGGGTTSAKISIGSTSINDGEWHHIVIGRESGNGFIYVDGASQTLDTDASSGVNFNPSASYTKIGGMQASYGCAATISNLRLVLGSRVYTGSSYTVPTSPLTAITGTELLVAQDNRYKDNSSNSFACSWRGTTDVEYKTLVTPIGPFNVGSKYDVDTKGGSIFVSNAYHSFANNAAFQVGTGDFTMEFWTQFEPNFPTTSYWSAICAIGGVGYDEGGASFYMTNTGKLAVDCGTSGASGRLDASTNPDLRGSGWHHIALTRESGTLRLYVDGGQYQSTTGNTANINGSGTFGLALGASHQSLNNNGKGYIGPMRMLSEAIYTGSTLTVPTAPFDPNDSNTKFVFNADNAAVFDQRAGRDWVLSGSGPWISTSEYKFGTASYSFNGTDDTFYATHGPYGNAADVQFGTGDFTVEFWMKSSGSSNHYSTIGTISTSTPNGTWRISNKLNTAHGLFFMTHDGSVYTDHTLSSTNYNDNTWHHIAVVRESGTIRGYVDGDFVGSASSSVDFETDTNNLIVGGEYVTPSFYDGYLDDIRITKGKALYTGTSGSGDFTPPGAHKLR